MLPGSHRPALADIVPRARHAPPRQAPPPPEANEPDWRALIPEVLREPERITLLFQPIVALSEGEIVGYECLSRFEGPPGLTPDRWFAAADAQGVGAELEAIVVARCVELRATLPPNCFLTVNVSPHLITRPVLRDLLLSQADLAPLVVELTEHQQVRDLKPLVALRDELASRGVLMALDDAGSGYSGLHQIASVRPHLIKLDRALVTDADTDELKLALAELLGEFAGRLDAWLLAEGIETWAELEAFARLRVPLGQGYLLGRPAPPWAALDTDVAQRLRATAARASFAEHIASLVETVAILSDDVELPTSGTAILVDGDGRPRGLLRPAEPDGHRRVEVSLRVPSSASVTEVAQRVITRPVHCRFDPVVCVDPEGRPVGIVRVERLLQQLATLAATARTHA